MRATKTRRKRAPVYNPDPNDEKILRRNMDRLIDKYPGQYVIVCGGEIFVGRDVAKLERDARQKHPGITTTGSPIPRPKDLFCVL